VRYVAFSDVPAWYASRAQTLSEWRAFQPLCALQMEYSLAARGIELEFPPMCEELGMGLMTWGPLANGLLSGKYQAGEALDETKQGRLNLVGSHVTPEQIKLTERSWRIIAELEDVAREVGRSMPEVAINWVANRPAVGSVILGASRPEQIATTVQSLDFELPEKAKLRLDEASAPDRVIPYAFFDMMKQRINPGVAAKPASYSPHLGPSEAPSPHV
jgi:aryl-alcohol dehydrogenase-like predicted oxidoreductase